MTQSIRWRDGSPRVLREAKNEDVSVAASGNTDLLNMQVHGLAGLFVQFTVADNALDAFIIKGRAHQDATEITLYSAAADFTSPAGLIIDASGDLTTTAAAGTGWFVMDVIGLWDITIQASANGGAAVVDIYAGGV